MAIKQFDVDGPIITSDTKLASSKKSMLTTEEFEALQAEIDFEQMVRDSIRIKKDMFVSHKVNIFRDYDFDIDSPIGEGAFGKVYRATEFDTGKVCAVKRILKSNITN